MTRRLREGEIIALPCRHCARMSVHAPLRSGLFTRTCAECRKDTRIVMRAEKEDWRIWTEALLDQAHPSSAKR